MLYQVSNLFDWHDVSGIFHQNASLTGAVLMEAKLNVDRVIFAALSALQRTSAVI